MRGERIAAPIFALLLVTTAVGAGVAPAPVGQVKAELLGEGNCTFEDALLEGITGGLLYEDNCGDVKELSEEWNETDADQTRTQIHSQAGQLAAGNEQFLTVQNNYLTDSNTIAFSKGEAAAVKVLANGGNVSEAKAAANESISDYYTAKQLNEMDRWSVAVETIKTLDQRGKNTTGVSEDYVTVGSETSYIGDVRTSDDWDIYYTNVTGTTTEQITLLNGTSAVYDELVVSYKAYGTSSSTGNSGTASGEFRIDYIGDNTTYTGRFERRINTAGPGPAYVTMDKVRVRASDNLTSRTAVDLREFWKTWRNIEESRNSTQKEVAVYVNQSLAPAVKSGDLNATSYVSPATLAQEYAQEYGNDSSYIRATAMAAYSGMDTPDLNETGSMTVTHDGNTYTGLLLSQEAPSGGWQSGETYDPALLSGLQMFAVAGENGSIVELDGSFTIEKITGTGGDEISKATTVNVTYETSNASANYTELQQQIRELNQQIEEREAQATAGTGGDSGPEIPSGPVVIAVGAAAAAVLLRQRD